MTNQDSRTRTLELLCDRTVQGLSSEEDRELDRLLDRHPDLDDESVDLAAAAAFLAQAPVAEPMPDTVRFRIARDAGLHVRPTVVHREDRLRIHPAWMAAAAALVLAVGGWWQALSPTAIPDPENSRAALLGDATVQLDWTATEDPAARGARGDVVWSDETQEGYMLIQGLAANDPSEEQYQLWVFPADGDARYPVDGGVFDIPPGTDSVIVPIDAKIDLRNPVLFAVTVEEPGGVVVSQRERIVLLAQAGG